LALFGRRPPERVDRFDIPASENQHNKRHKRLQVCRAQSIDFSGGRMNFLLSLPTAGRRWSDETALLMKLLIAGAIGPVFFCVALLYVARPAAAQFIQQGPALIGTGTSGPVLAAQGSSVAMSADGNTAIVGGPYDGDELGSVWVYIRSGGVWTQQGPKLVGTGETGTALLGQSVALSADGNTAIVGGWFDNNQAGAVWVFTRGGGTWTQQGSKLVGTGAGGAARQGQSVALSADGNTAIVGGPADSNDLGAVWVFTQSGGTWTQQGAKLTASGVGNPQLGNSVALSADGNTAIAGGPQDNTRSGATWVFTRTGGSWTQQGPKLTGFDAIGSALQGSSVALSADGNTAVVGGPGDNSSAGASWIFTRTGNSWTQRGLKLSGMGAIGAAQQGLSVAVSGYGTTAIVGGPFDNDAGAAWVFTQDLGGVWSQQVPKLVGTGNGGAQGSSVALSAGGATALVGGPGGAGAAWAFVLLSSVTEKTSTHDFNGDGYSDIAWRDTSGNVAIWEMTATGVLNSTSLGNLTTLWTIAGLRDFNGDGFADILWRNSIGDVAIWEMGGAEVHLPLWVGNMSTDWSVVGTGDFNGDGVGDILWRDTNGNVAIWLMNGSQILNVNDAFVANVPTTWAIVGSGDFNGDGTNDILWRDTSGNTATWFMSGTQVLSTAGIGNIPVAWSVVGTGDFNNDGYRDIVWRDTSGDTSIWLMKGASVLASSGLGNVSATWSMVQTGDYNDDGKSDLLWRDTSGNTAIWFMNGTQVASTAGVGNIPTNWTVQSANSE
jgi:FG-GAP-like repeat